MRRKSFPGNRFPSVELIVLMWLSQGSWTVSCSSSPSASSLFRLRSNYYFGVTLVSLLLPWTVSGEEPTIQIVETIPLEESSGRSFSARSSIGSTGDNELLANIDFLTQLTNSKQGKDSEMDPLKCFPKALCGLSAESAAITRRRKTGLITDYIRLMKAVSLNPSVMEKTMKKLQQKVLEPEEQQDDVDDNSDSDEDEDEEEDEFDDIDDGHRGRSGLSKRTSPSGYGYGSASVKPAKKKKKSTSVPTSATPSRSPSPSPSSSGSGKKKRRTKKESIPANSNEFTKQYLHERAHVEKLMEDGFYNEETDAQNWWNYENEKEPSLEQLLDDSGGRLDSNSVESFYTFGGKRKPDRPYAPYKPDGPPQPNAPDMPYIMEPQSPPPRPQPPQAPSVRVPPSGGSGSGSVAAIGNFFRGLFGFNNGQSQQDFSRDPFFQGFQRSMADGTPTLVTVDKTKEILTTAIEIGESLRSPNQCNTLFNGCKYQYVELLHVIDEIRQNLADKGKIDFQTDGFTSEEHNDEWKSGSKLGKRKQNKDRSYGYEASLSATSQAETLSPDYTSAASKVVKKSRRRSGKRKNKSSSKSSSSREPDSTLEIASDEPTMYGSAGHHISESPFKDGRGDRYQGHASQYHYDQTAPQLQHHSYHNSYYSEYLHDKESKGFWGTIMSWFGFRRK